MGVRDAAMRERVIYHADINNCYASIEILHHPRLRGHPVAVGGDVEARHGIILAKNYEAKDFGIQVGNTLWEARQKCPELLIVPPTYDLYQRVSRDFKAILGEYTDQMESFGLDEQWMDVTHSLSIFSDSAEKLANEIRERVYREIGVTISIGVANNKIFAKLGSDYKKPNACTAITKENYKDIVWPLPAGDLLGVGPATQKKLYSRGVKTIGDIARLEPQTLQSWFGKWGLILSAFSNGYDTSPVDASQSAKNISVGNSTTTPRDLIDESDCHVVFLNLAESVAERVRLLGFKGKTVEISLRDNALQSITRQRTLSQPTNLAIEMTKTAMGLLREHYKWEKPLRSIGIRATNFVSDDGIHQLSLFDDGKRERMEMIERTIDNIRHRFGHYAIGRGALMSDKSLGWINPIGDHTIHPVGYF